MSKSNLKNKNLLGAVNLVEELDNNAAEAISGGQVGEFTNTLVAQPTPLTQIRLDNKTNLPIYVDVDYGRYSPDVRINSGTSRTFASTADSGTVDFDSNYCVPGIQLRTRTVYPGSKYELRFSSDCNLSLNYAGSIA